MIQIVCPGKLREKATRELVNEYLKRLAPYTRLEITEVADEANNQYEDSKVKQLEGERILRHVKDSSYVVLLDLRGKSLTSEKLAEKISEIYTYHSSDITFIIGGSLGVSDDVYRRADFVWKLSDLTFPHNLVRVVLLEQIYRAFKINNHEPYHK